MIKEEYKNNATVKTLLNVGFSEEYIMKSIENGDIKLEKSKDEKELDSSLKKEEDNVADDKKHLKDLDKDKGEDEKDEKDLEKDKKKEADMEKSITTNLLKSLGDTFGTTLVESLTPLFKGLNARFDAQDEIIKSMKTQAPGFKSGDLDRASVLEKSIESFKGEDGKISMNIITQRTAVKKLIEKSLDDPDFMKSFGDEVSSYLMYPEAETVPEGVARYMYKNMGVKLVK